MFLIQIISIIVIFVWFPTNPGWLGIPLVGWFMFFAFFIWGLQTIVYVYWTESLDRSNKNYHESMNKNVIKQ